LVIIILIFLLYSVGHHSTSDDSTAYRPKEEIGMWSETENPVGKFRRYLETKGLWSEEEEKNWAKDARKQVPVYHFVIYRN
jgi:2-oxoisovalerate dehydrogenase E1 component alpha subunit